MTARRIGAAGLLIVLAVIGGCDSSSGSASTYTLAPSPGQVGGSGTGTATSAASTSGGSSAPSDPSVSSAMVTASPSGGGASTPTSAGQAPSSTSTSTASSAATTTTTIAVTTTTEAPTTTTTIALVTDGALVLIANAAAVPGAARDLTATLQALGYAMKDPTNAAGYEETLAVSKIYFRPEAEAAARSLGLVMQIASVTRMPTPAPIVDAQVGLGDATVLIMLGSDRAGQPIPGLQGR